MGFNQIIEWPLIEVWWYSKLTTIRLGLREGYFIS